MVQLRKCDSHFTATRSRCGYNHKPTLGFYILVAAITLVADNACVIVGIAFDREVAVHLDSERAESLFKRNRCALSCVMGDNNAADIQSYFAESVNKTQCVKVIGDTKVAPHLVFLYIICAYDDNDLRFVFELH
ncbi:hypothetical protein SDC9_204134 [bioreactor metagenome]|uniref:Uncharacterized protein n=1 Tax=bioreactor metagenome TaxID=1076179 RepID=A0A645IYC2_9ZZZZ